MWRCSSPSTVCGLHDYLPRVQARHFTVTPRSPFHPAPRYLTDSSSHTLRTHTAPSLICWVLAGTAFAAVGLYHTHTTFYLTCDCAHVPLPQHRSSHSGYDGPLTCRHTPVHYRLYLRRCFAHRLPRSTRLPTFSRYPTCPENCGTLYPHG